MNLVPAAITTRVGRNVLLLQKNSPNLLFGAGIVGVVGGTVLACRATLKMDAVLSEASAKMSKVNDLEHPEYHENDREHDVALLRVQTTVKIVRLYTPAIVVGGLGIAALTGSHRILTNRNAGLTAAYAALDEAFSRYRGRVVEKYGEEQDYEFRYDSEQVEIGEGTKKKTVKRIAPNGVSGYAKFFDQYSSSWSKDPELNLYFLKCQQNYINDLLHVRGHVFLNEVYDRLGMDRTKAGSVVGWILSTDGSTDNYISFGVFEGQRENARDFVNGREGAVLCDFNVDGVIYDKFERPRERTSWQLEA